MITRFHRTAILLLLTLFAGCYSYPIRLTQSAKRPAVLKEGRPIQAEACGYQLFLVIPIEMNNRQQRAWRQLKFRARDAYIADIRMEESWFWGFIGTVYCTKFRAIAYKGK